MIQRIADFSHSAMPSVSATALISTQLHHQRHIIARCIELTSATTLISTALPVSIMQMHPGARRHANTRNGARRNAIFAMPYGLLVLNVKVAHAPAQMYLTGTPAFGSASEVDGAAGRGR